MNRVYCLDKLIQHVARHIRVDFTSQLNEAGCDTEPACLPSEVEGIDRNTMATEAWPRIEWHVTERLGGCRIDYVPYVDAHRGVNNFQFIHQGDVDRPKDILGQLDGFRGLQAGNRNHLGKHLPIEKGRQAGCLRTVAADHLGDGGRGELVVAGILALRRIGEEKILATTQPTGLENGLHYFRAGAGIGGGFQHHQLPTTKMAGDFPGRVLHIGQIRFAMPVQRGRDADQNGISLMQPAEVCRDHQPLLLNQALDIFISYVINITVAGIQHLNLSGVGIVAVNLEAFTSDSAGQGQADIAQANDGNLGAMPAETILQNGIQTGGVGTIQARAAGIHAARAFHWAGRLIELPQIALRRLATIRSCTGSSR